MTRLLAISVLMAVGSFSHAAAYLPYMKTFQGTRISPTTAAAYYASATPPPDALHIANEQVEVQELARGLGSTHLIAGQIAADTYAARVFEYVRQNIKTIFIYGLQKGARGALIDQAGTSFDQANLVVELLRAGGITANYQSGTITLNAQQFSDWAGITSAAAACQTLADGGFPVVVNGSTASGCSLTGNVAAVQLAHIWVSALGKLFDASYKKHTQVAGINLATSIGCGTLAAPTCGSLAVTAATPTLASDRASIGGASAWKNVRYATLGSQLQTFAANLQNSLAQSYPNASISDVVGGSAIDLASIPTPSSTLTYADPGPTTWTEIPDQYRTTLRVQFDTINTLLFVDEIYGRRLRLFGYISPTPGTGTTPVQRKVALYLEYRVLAGATRSDGTIDNDILTLSVNHPYAASSGTFADDTVAMSTYAQVSNGSTSNSFQVFSPLTIVHGWGDTGASAIDHFSALQAKNMLNLNIIDPTNPLHVLVSNPQVPADLLCTSTTLELPLWLGTTAGWSRTRPQCLGLHQATTAATWLAEDSQMSRLIAAVNSTSIQNHHALGWIASCGICGTSMSIEYARSATSVTGSAPDRQAAMVSMAAMSSRLEGSIAEQSQDAWEGVSAISLLKRANEKSIALMELNSSNFATASAQLQNFPSSLITLLQTSVNSPLSYSIVVPRNWQFGNFVFPNATLTFSVGAYAGANASGDRVSFAVGTDGLKGSSNVSSRDPLRESLDSAKLSALSGKSRDYYGVNLAQGALTLTPPPDLVTGTGGFPAALEFRRYFNSANRPWPYHLGECTDLGLGGGLTCLSVPASLADEPALSLGHGWRHNLHVAAALGSDAHQAMGEDSGLDAASTVAALFTLRQIYRGTQSLSTRITGMFVADWWAMTLPNNSVTVTNGNSSETFVRLPSPIGTFNPPPNSASKLTQTGQRTGPYGGAGILYEYSALQFSLAYKDGSQLNFSPNFTVSSEFLSTIHGLGRKDFRGTSWAFPNGIAVTFSYVDGGLPAHESYGCLRTVANNLGRQLTYTGSGTPMNACRLTQVQDESGRTFSWQTTGMLPGTIIATAADGAQTRYEYQGIPITNPKLGFMPWKWFTPSDAANPYIQVQYDDLNRISRVTDAANNSTDYFIGSLNSEEFRRGESRDPLGAVNAAYFDRFGQALQSIDALGRTVVSQYDAAQRLKKQILPEGNTVEYAYDTRHNLTQTIRTPKPGSGDPTITTSALYPATCTYPASCNQPTSTTDGRGAVTGYTYNNSTGQLLTVSYPAVTEGTPFASFGYQTMPTSPSVSMLTSKTARITSTPTQTNLVTTYSYSSANKYVLQSAVVDSGGLNLTTSFVFDSIGNLTQVNGPRTDVTDTTTYQWDTNRRLKQADGQLSASTRYSYDLDGQLIRTERWDDTASVWRAEDRTYWATGDLKRITDPEGHVTSYDYDAVGRPTYLTEPVDATKNRITRTVYNLAGQKTEEYRGWGSADQIRYGRWGYTLNGKVDWVEEAVASTAGQTTSVSGRRTAYTYDGHDRLRRMSMPSSSPGVASTTDYEEYSYDNNSNLTASRNRDAKTITISVIDAMNRERTRNVPANAGGLYARTLTTTYDLLGRKKTAVADGQTLTFNYDTPGRVTSVVDSILGTTSYLYDPVGNLTQVTWPGTGGYVTYTYDALNRVDLVRESGTSLIADYTWDSLSRRQLMTYGNNATADWSYFPDDALSTLVQTVPYTGGSRAATFTLGHNRVNQITSLSVAVSDPSLQLNDIQLLAGPSATATTAYVANHLNEYTGVGGTAHSYDANGNLLTDGVRTFSYDEENRLRSATGGGYTVSYDHDPLGRRRAKTVNGTVTRFLSDGQEEIGEYTSTNSLLHRYVYGPAIDERLVQIEVGGTRTYLHTNYQGSTVLTSDATGTVNPLRYDAFGQSDNAPTGVAFRYTGRRFDPETGLYYYRARYYSPKLGRFLQTDPIGVKDDLNLYAYVYNDPVNRTDPSGQFENCEQFLEFVGSRASCWESWSPNHAAQMILHTNRLPDESTAQEHWMSLDALTIEVPMSSIGLSDADIADSREFQETFRNLAPGQTARIENGTLVVEFSPIDYPFATQQQKVIGTHTYSYSGTLARSEDGDSFAFSGTIWSKKGGEMFNYDIKNAQGTFMRDRLTSLRKPDAPGRDFWLAITGTVKFRQSSP